jgi:hypothetical protein
MRNSGLLWLAAALAGCALAAPPLTTIQDVLYKADGTPFNGTLTIGWSSFQASDNSAIVTQSTTVKVVAGNLHVQLVPTTSGTPAVYYTVTYNSDGRVQFQETWSVPSSAQPVRLRDVRVAAAGADTGGNGSGTGGTGGGVAADTTVLESDVVGLIADLAARPQMGPGYAAGRVAVVNALGALESAVGNATDCVHVDGSSGPCGDVQPAYVDGDLPAGIVDGANTTFTLTDTPDPAASLALYRNGLLQKAEQDYTLTGAAVQFVAADAPQPGDTLLASYRFDGGSGSLARPDYRPRAAHAGTPEVLCSGTGAATASGMASLGTCTIPAGKVTPGDRVEARFDFEHEGHGAGWSVEVHWGGSTVLRRQAAASEGLLTGRIEAAITVSGAQVSGQSWGSATSLAATASETSDGYDGGLKMDFQGGPAAPGDRVTLRGFTVVRWP